MFIPKIVGREENALNEAKEQPGMTNEELAQIMELLGGGGFIDDPIPPIPRPPRPRLAAVYTCPGCAANPPAMTTTACDLCWGKERSCHHNPQDGYVCIACAADNGLCSHCGHPKPAGRQPKR